MGSPAPRNEGAALILTSPSGKTFAISVDDMGKLTSAPGGAPAQSTAFAPITATGMATAANPPGTTSASYVMMGLGLSLASIAATEAFINISGVIANSVNNGQSDAAMFIGTGPAPANGDAPPGLAVQIGQSVSFKSSAGSGALAPFALTVISDVTPGQTYWIDLGLRANAGTASVSNINACCLFLP